MDTDGFVRDGHVVVRGAFDADTAAACRPSIWDALATHGVRPDDRSTWTRPSMYKLALDGSDRSPVAQAIIEGITDTSQLRPRT